MFNKLAQGGLGVVLLFVLSACSKAPDDAEQAETAAVKTVAPVAQAKVLRGNDPDQRLRGGQIFQQYCATCHGKQGQGAFNWRQPGADGKYPPPPLNGTGHAWHHPYAMLSYVIKKGSPGGQGNMPAWGDTLSDQEIADVIAWFQIQWSDEAYAAWYRNDQRARNR